MELVDQGQHPRFQSYLTVTLRPPNAFHFWHESYEFDVKRIKRFRLTTQ